MMERKIGEEGNIIDFYIIGDLGKSSLSRCWGVELTVNSVLLFVKWRFEFFSWNLKFRELGICNNQEKEEEEGSINWSINWTKY